MAIACLREGLTPYLVRDGVRAALDRGELDMVDQAE
jgi:hypothetical protein